MKKKIALDIVCQSCGGTGLYVGMCERDGCAVVCRDCDGTGCEKYEFEYELFKQRKLKRVKRIFETTCGYMHSANDVTTKEGKLIKFSEAGCMYKDWLKGAKPKPVKELYCPYQWTGQGLQSKDVNNLYKNRCKNMLGLLISDCQYHKEKEKCWRIFEGVK